GFSGLPLGFELEQNALEPILGFHAFVEVKLQFGDAPESNPAPDLSAEKRGRATERALGLLARPLVAHERVVHARQLKVWRHLDARERDKPDARIVDVAQQELAELLANLFSDAIRT